MTAAGLVGLVVVSHSRALARAAVGLAQEMVHGRQLKITIAAGLDDTTFGTDATQIVEAITAADQGAGVVVLMDLGSAVLSAELALDLLDDDLRERVVLCPAPLVEGLVVAAVAAAGGSSAAEVVAEATGALAGKIGHLDPAPATVSTVEAPAEAGELTGSFVVANPHGLHARPAARLVQEARRRDARAFIRNRSTNSEWVGAGSLSKIATLGVRSGHEVEVRVSGSQAAETLDHILALAARHFDEPLSEPSVTTAEPVGAQAPIGASPGLGIGPARSAQKRPIAIPDTAAEDPTAEWRRVSKAIAGVRRTIGQLRTRTAREVGEAEASIFDAHQLLLDDTELLDGVRARINAGESAVAAWSAAVTDVAAEFTALPDPYLKARAEDVTAVGDQVLRAMLGSAVAAVDTTGILVAADLTPAEAAELVPDQVAAVVLAFGSPHSHNVILLRAKGIPAVVGAGPALLGIAEGTVVAVDGTSGEFIVDPPEDIRRQFGDRVAALALRQRTARARATEPAITTDGVIVPVGANLGSVDDARAAVAAGADYAGLIRTEFLFLGRPVAPDVEEQTAVYRKIAESMDGRRITLRTLDVGGDKPLDFLPTPAEMNPFLGVRGIRLSLHHPQLLSDQLVAIARVAQQTPVSVMFPMVSTLDELFAARRLLDEALAATGRPCPADLEVGMMVEVPAAALKAAAFARHVDFLSIGTNDLTQYALAADRNNDAVAGIGDTFDPGLLALIRSTCRGAAGHASVSVCGEFAADERATGLLIGLGVDALSVTPPAIATTKEAVRALDSRRATAAAGWALTADSASAVRQHLDPRTGA
ncbi:phosphoenolpyruvate--protein phosphotransferase [Mycolicibacterium pyrenivorans]|uniref:phosphoenolpyruvate--protein phosphotransferase n=1 Tax=Mycolicibacterium pyrenivorans TaxID=187102 RepID=UPI0021F29808|nr:phosphoenolpyruvate--protein phosphotransferase [Mycolicibacterium pyrenivorans]MCV7155058.1 phosphoenolpyruvate--protein phosphotransferase [Mycolicibacterium pyrenivorans]